MKEGLLRRRKGLREILEEKKKRIERGLLRRKRRRRGRSGKWSFHGDFAKSNPSQLR